MVARALWNASAASDVPTLRQIEGSPGAVDAPEKRPESQDRRAVARGQVGLLRLGAAVQPGQRISPQLHEQREVVVR